VFDLLRPGSSDLPIREDASRQIVIPNLSRQKIESFSDFQGIYEAGCRNRKKGILHSFHHSLVLVVWFIFYKSMLVYSFCWWPCCLLITKLENNTRSYKPQRELVSIACNPAVDRAEEAAQRHPNGEASLDRSRWIRRQPQDRQQGNKATS